MITSVLKPSDVEIKSIKCFLGDFGKIKIKLLHTGNFGVLINRKQHVLH